MPDSKTEALSVTSKEDKLIKPTQKEDTFVPKIKVKMTDGSVMVVPRDSDANKNQSIILAEHARNFILEQIKLFSSKGRPLTPAELKELMTAAKIANDIAIVAHEDIFVPTEKIGKSGSSSTGTMLKAVEAAAKGVASGNAEAANKAIEKFMKLGKEAKMAASVDVVATEVK